MRLASACSSTLPFPHRDRGCSDHGFPDFEYAPTKYLLIRCTNWPLLAEHVTSNNDYSVRAPKQAGGEVGVLTDALNNMLEEIHQQNERVHESGARMRAVLNAAISAVVVIDRDGRITDWNGRAEIIFGWKRDEVIGRESCRNYYSTELSRSPSPGDSALFQNRRRTGARQSD